MIVGYVTLGPDGMTLLPRPGARGAGAELLLSPRLYVRLDEEHEWPDSVGRRLTARVGRRKYVTSEEVLTRARGLHGGPRAVSLVPTEVIFPGAQSDEQGLLAIAGCDNTAGNPTAKLARNVNHAHRRHRFRAPRNRARHTLLVLACVLCTVSVAACLVTRRTAQHAHAALVVSMSALASAEGRANTVNELLQQAETLQRTIADLDHFAFLPPATLIGTIVAALPATVTAQRVSVGGYRFVVDARGSTLLPAARKLEALPMVTDVTVQSRSEDDGLVSGQIRGRLGP